MQADPHLSPPAFLKKLGISATGLKKFHYQQSPGALVEQTLERHEGKLNDSGALVIRTGKFTGRSPKDRFIVQDATTRDTVDWNAINQPLSSEHYDRLRQRVINHLKDAEIWMRDCYACSAPRYRIGIRIITELPWASLFCHNMFLRPSLKELEHFQPEWTILHTPDCQADPHTEGTRQGNFTVINFEAHEILIGGSAYTGEIKKGIFSVLNYLLPLHQNVLGMHCAANVGANGETALFFGLSGTGKTTLSTDASRDLIGDDEHGWGVDGIFNFEGGCYAKCINLNRESEPEIFQAIRHGALLENVRFHPGSDHVNFSDQSITENTRVSYPLHYLNHTSGAPAGSAPRHIFFLSCDAFGVLPPLSRLDNRQAIYQFLSGYTAKVAGTEAGITEPNATFSACYGAPFLPLPAMRYAEMLGERIRSSATHCWLVNTGWTGGRFGEGKRIPLEYTRALVNAALSGNLNAVAFSPDPILGMEIPSNCPGIPDEILRPRDTWAEASDYDKQATALTDMFKDNFRQFSKSNGTFVSAGKE